MAWVIIPYYSLAAGFLRGKYRSEADYGKSTRGRDLAKYLTPRGLRGAGRAGQVAADTGTSPAQVALAWLLARPA